MYDSDLMMATVAASTALAGLSGVIVWQVVDPGARGVHQARKWIRCSFLVAWFAVISSLLWFVAPESWQCTVKTIAVALFGIQVSVFVFATVFRGPK